MENYRSISEKILTEQAGLISRDIRLDIGIRPGCPLCSNLAGSAMKIAALSPRITVHLLDLGWTADPSNQNTDRKSGQNKTIPAFRVPFVMVNKRYIFFGSRSPVQLLIMIAEVI